MSDAAMDVQPKGGMLRMIRRASLLFFQTRSKNREASDDGQPAILGDLKMFLRTLLFLLSPGGATLAADDDGGLWYLNAGQGDKK